MQTLTIVLLCVLIIIGIISIVLHITKKTDSSENQDFFKLETTLNRIEPAVREEFSRSRTENQDAFKSNREEVNTSFLRLTENVTKTMEALANAQKNQFDTFSQQLENLVKTVDEKINQLTEKTETAAKENRGELNTSFKILGENLTKTVAELSNAQKNQFESYSNRLADLTRVFDEKTQLLAEQLATSAKENRAEQSISLKSFEQTFTQNVKDFNELQRQKFDDLTSKQELKLKDIRETIEGKLTHIQEDNNKRLEEMRKTVDEKLQESINKRFNESFELISKRLEEVQKGLGEMQTLASDVGGLKKVLTNVKTRGTFGEVQLESILEQIFAASQYETQAAVRVGSAERVDAVIKLPGQTADGRELLLPIDSKFPVEDYQRLYDAYELGESKESIMAFRKKFEDSVKITAKSIAQKYINVPATTDFAIMFVPSEGIYAEILRNVDVFESLRRDYKITVVGPTNLAAFLSSLHMGFRTLAIQKRTSEVWEILGAVKTEFGKFGDVLEGASRQLQTVANSISKAETRTRAIERNLRKVEALPEEQSKKVLGNIDETDTRLPADEDDNLFATI
ncbi:MAG: DNA recombination protein RmuC [Bacteroidales bacterium]|nr:DNA recombination protein RmuC [Bacteroidales bacterium]